MFLGWVPQLLAYLNSDRIFAISGLVERIADTYPQAVMFPYRLSRKSYNNSDNLEVSKEVTYITDKYE